MSQWARWRLDSPASRLLSQPFVQTQITENIKALRLWPLRGKFTGHRWIPSQRASNAENVSIWWRHHITLSLLCCIHHHIIFDRDVASISCIMHPISIAISLTFCTVEDFYSTSIIVLAISVFEKSSVNDNSLTCLWHSFLCPEVVSTQNQKLHNWHCFRKEKRFTIHHSLVFHCIHHVRVKKNCIGFVVFCSGR